MPSWRTVLAVTNLHAFSEFGMFSVSCSAHLEQFHLLLGHLFVEVVDDNGLTVQLRAARSYLGQLNFLIATRRRSRPA